jgi:patched domain-containing protein
MSSRNLFEVLFKKLNKFYEELFKAYGLFISKYYLHSIIITCLINLLFALCLFRFQMIYDLDELYVVSDSKAKYNEIYLKNLFNETRDISSRYLTHQLLDLGCWAEINFHVSSNKYENILNEKYFNEILKIHEEIIKISVYDRKLNKNLTYFDLCARRHNNVCAYEGVGLLNNEFFDYLNEKLNEKKEITNSTQSLVHSFEPYVDSNSNSLSFLHYNLGKNFTHSYSNVFKLRYALNSPFAPLNSNIEKWSSAFVSFMKNHKGNLTTFTFSTSHSISEEINRNLDFDWYLYAYTFMLICLFSIILMSFGSNCITTPGIILPLAGILSAGYGLVSAVGLLSLFGFKCANIIIVVPFLILGIGIDDMFIIYSAFTQTNSEWKTSKRMSFALKNAGVSITITSLTDFVALIVGLSANFKSVKIFCLVAAISIAFCYLYQLTFFCPWLVIHSNRIKQKKNGLICCLKQNNAIESSRSKVESKSKSKFSWLSFKFIGKIYHFLITNKVGKFLVGILFAIYITLAIYNTINIGEGIDHSHLVSDDSFFKDFVIDNNEFIEASPFVQIVFYKPIEYTSDVQAKITKFLHETLKIKGIRSDFLINWMDAYSFMLDKYYETRNVSYLNRILDDLSPFSSDIIIKQNEIVASRFYIQYETNEFSSRDALPMKNLYELCEQSGLPVFPYAVTFKIYEQYEQTISSIIQAFIISLESMYIISLLFIPDLISTFCILASMISIMLGLIGGMHLMGFTLSSITMIELIMSIGFCIDFSVHVTHSYITCNKNTSTSERAYQACIHTGIPILNSAISTVAGFILLLFKHSFVYYTFFQTVFILMFLGVLNSMLFLPVLLSLVGPNWKYINEKEEEEEIGKLDNNLTKTNGNH